MVGIMAEMAAPEEKIDFFVQVVADKKTCGTRKARRNYAFVGRRDSLGTFHGMHTIYSGLGVSAIANNGYGTAWLTSPSL